jgi:enoyl-CoA hydratase
VTTDRRKNVLLITMNRPRVRNAIDVAVSNGLVSALDELECDDGLRVGVLTGAGGTFCAGMDLKSFLSTSREEHAAVDRAFLRLVRRRASGKVLIAAVEGFAVAGGLELAVACDLIVAARDAQLGIPEVRRGLVAAGGALIHLPQRLPLNVAMEMTVTGNPIDAERAYDLGLVNRLCDPGEAVDAALAVANEIVGNAPIALSASKAILQQQFDWTYDEAWEKQDEIAAPVNDLDSADAREGAAAFLDKRPAEWSGDCSPNA